MVLFGLFVNYEKQKSPPCKSDELDKWLLFSQNYSLTYLIVRVAQMELAPSTDRDFPQGCQGFTGPCPSAFLDKFIYKELGQKYREPFCFPKKDLTNNGKYQFYPDMKSPRPVAHPIMN